MNIRVQMLAFGKPGEIRMVEVPDHLWTEDNQANLETVFEFGQNEIQPQSHPSISVGDIIELDNLFYIVRPFGFLGLTQNQYDEYNGLSSRDRLFSPLVKMDTKNEGS